MLPNVSEKERTNHIVYQVLDGKKSAMNNQGVAQLSYTHNDLNQLPE